jgi:hypothetical protein
MAQAEEKRKCQWFWEKADDLAGWVLAFLTDPIPHPLAKTHWMACGLMMTQAVVTAILAALKGTRFGQEIDFKTKHLVTMPVTPLVSCFMFVAGFGHFLAGRSNLFVRITQHRSWVRWAEKFVSVGLMYSAVALLCDKEAAVPLLWLVLLNGFSMGIRFVMERDVHHKLYGSGRHALLHPPAIRSKNIVGRFTDAIDEGVALVASIKESEEDDDELEIAEPIPVQPEGGTLPSDWEVITGSLLMDAIALAMFLPYYIDDVKDEKWFVHASVVVMIVTIVGYTGLVLLYRRAALKLKAGAQFLQEAVFADSEKEDAGKWRDQEPALTRTKLDEVYEQLETWLIGWSVLTTSGLGWLIIIGAYQS